MADTPLVGGVCSTGLHGRYGKIRDAVESADQLPLRRRGMHNAPTTNIRNRQGNG
jgi:hypothetical protein